MANTVSIKTVYPMDSEITQVDSDGLPVYDRAYNAADLRQVMRVFLTDGVLTVGGDCLGITNDAGTWTLSAGSAIAKGLIINIYQPVAVITQSQIATGQYAHVIVAARFDSDKRDAAVYTVLSRNVEREPIRNESIWELEVARIDWRGEYKDLRLDTHYCGAAAPREPVDTDSFMQSLSTALSQFDINVGTVESLDSGATPIVQVQKPEKPGDKVVINFGIPRGAPGKQGTDGHGVHVAPADHPPTAQYDSVWLVEDKSTIPHTITDIEVYESEGTYPGALCYPGADTYPGGSGQWVKHKLDPALLQGDVKNGE